MIRVTLLCGRALSERALWRLLSHAEVPCQGRPFSPCERPQECPELLYQARRHVCETRESNAALRCKGAMESR